VLDNATLTDEEVALFEAFAGDEELENWHTRPNIDPHLEIGEDPASGWVVRER
jgi:hypothetical protein